MSKVLLLTAGYGEGHNAAARGLREALVELGADAEIVDVFAETSGAFYQWSRRTYVEIITRLPHVWAAAYHAIDHLPVGALVSPLLAASQQALADRISAARPDIVVSVYPIYGYLIAREFPASEARPFRFHTLITDSITVNSIWLRSPADTVLVPNEDTAAMLRGHGLSEPRLRVIGFPVSTKFAHHRPSRPAPPPPRVLYMINSGKDSAPQVVRELLSIPELHLTVTVGRDESLRRKIESVAGEIGRPVEIHGWTDRMPELLMTHHVLIGKAGGATVQECIAAGTPLLMTQVVPGQEEGNAELLLRNHCGAVCETPAALARQVSDLFADGAAEWQRWTQNLARLSRPDAALQIGRFLLNDVASHAPAPADATVT